MSPKPTPAELQILEILWDKKEATVRDVHEIISEIKSVRYTTTLKIMQNMHDKGFVEREMEGRSHVYMANLKRKKTHKKLLDEFLDNHYGSSPLKLVAQIIEGKKLSKKDLTEIKSLIKKVEKKKQA